MPDSIYSTLTVTNTLPSGAAFAIQHGTGASCYIPATVVYNTKASPGDVVQAILVDNPNLDVKDRTPYMAQYIKPQQLDLNIPAPAPAPAPAVSTRARVEDFVCAEMHAGGVWTVLSMFREYMKDDEAVREDDTQAYNAVSATLRRMFDDDECAKWSMWSKKSQTRVGREWFSCYPRNVDVAEWETT